MDPKSPFLHERLQAYDFALSFYRHVKFIRKKIPRGLGEVNGQMTRASLSICYNLAEGAAYRSPDMKRRAFEIALGSAGECASILDTLEIEQVVETERIQQARADLRGATLRLLGLIR